LIAAAPRFARAARIFGCWNAGVAQRKVNAVQRQPILPSGQPLIRFLYATLAGVTALLAAAAAVGVALLIDALYR
jgi:hypothetical protein